MWLSTRQAAGRAGRNVQIVRRAAEAEELHGHQPMDGRGRPVPKSRWSFHPAAVDVWVQGGDERAQRKACGCAGLRVVGRAS